jgi:cold shock CspA family protein
MMPNACVKNWLRDRKFGFLYFPGDAKKVIFAHANSVPLRDGLRELKADEEVEVSYVENPDGRLRAVKVMPVNQTVYPS